MSLKDAVFSADTEIDDGEKSDDTLDWYDPAHCVWTSSSDSSDVISARGSENGSPLLQPHCSQTVADEYDPTNCLSTSSSDSSDVVSAQGSENGSPLLQPHCSQTVTDDQRPLRKKRKYTASESCPVCGITVRQQQLKDHYELELKKLDSLQKKLKRGLLESPRYKKLQEVRSRRMKRSQGSKVLKDVGVNTCEVCHPIDTTEIGPSYARSVLHLTQCAGLVDSMADSMIDESQQSEEESFDEYSIGGEERIRISSFIDSIADLPHHRIQNTEEDCVIVIDSDDDSTFGPSEFTERDLQPCESTLSDKNVAALREAVLSSSENRKLPKTLNNETPEKEEEELNSIFDESVDIPPSNVTKIQEERLPSPTSIVLSALKNKLQELENEVQNSTVKCNICMEAYKDPLVSVTCWHVSCKECWMKTLGEKKLCPQCSKITLPASLRKVYM